MMHPHLWSVLASALSAIISGMVAALPAISDVVCTAFALWTIPALWRVISSRSVRPADPLRVIALLLISGRYGFTFDRWMFGAHPEVRTHAEEIGREGAFVWSIVTVTVAALVIRGYRKLV